jgi:uncharacterized membrane protein YfcA
MLFTAIDGAVLRPYVASYLGLMGVYILYRAWRAARPVQDHRPAIVAPLGLVGGFADAVGGGGWGPVVTTGLVGAGGAPRETIGTVNTVEFFLTFAVSLAFVVALLTGHWEDAGGLAQYVSAVSGLIVGGVLAAPLAGYVTRVLPQRVLMVAVGVLVSLLAVYQIARLV